MKMRFGIFALSCALAAAATAAELERVELDQDGRKTVFVRFGETRFLEIAVGELATAAAGLPVCVSGRLALDPRPEGVTLRGAPADLPLRFAPGVTLEAQRGGEVFLGGRNEIEGGRSFRIEVALALPAEAARFTARVRSLGDADPEAWYALAWEAQESSRQAAGPEAEALQAIGKDAVRRGIAAEGDPEKADDARLAARLASAKKFAAIAAALPEEAEWYAAACRDLLAAQGPAAATIAAGKASPEIRRRLQAALLLRLGRVCREMAADGKRAATHFAAAARLAPSDPGVTAEMKALRWTLEGGRWVAPGEARKPATQPAAGPMTGAQGRASAADGLEKIALMVDPLLGDPAGGAELARGLDKLPLEAARYAVAQAGALSSGIALPVLAAGLKAPEPLLRQDAFDALLRRGPDQFKAAVEALAREENRQVADHALDAMRRLPGPARIDALLLALSSGEVPAATKKVAAKHLAEETGQAFGLDAFGWSQWWQKSRAGFSPKAP